jgi:ATP synthase protein I
MSSAYRVTDAFHWMRAAMSADQPTDPASGQISPAERAALKQRASDLGAKLETAKKRQVVPSASGKGAAAGRGMRAAAEMIGGVVAGGGIGWFLDSILGTKPWLFILFFLLGSAAGMLNIIRQAQREKTPPLPSVPDDDDEDDKVPDGKPR